MCELEKMLTDAYIEDREKFSEVCRVIETSVQAGASPAVLRRKLDEYKDRPVVLRLAV